MKFNLESFPIYDHNTMTHLQYWEKVQAWVIGCKLELRERLLKLDPLKILDASEFYFIREFLREEAQPSP